MALKAILDNLDNVPEALKSEYKAGTAGSPTEGKFVLDVENVGGFALEDVSGLKTALGTERTLHGQTKDRVKAFEGIDPQAAKDAIAKVAEFGQLDPKKDVDRLVEEKLNAQLGQIRDQHNGDLSKKDGAIKARDELIEGTFRREAAIKALAESKGDVDLLLPHVLPHVKFELEEVDDNGRTKLVPKTKIVDGQGNVRIGRDMNNMSLSELVTEMKSSDKFGRLFEGSGHEGTGDRKTTTTGGGQTGGKKIADMSRKEKAALIGELGQAKYNERANEERAAAQASA